MDRTFDFGSKGWGFESLRGHTNKNKGLRMNMEDEDTFEAWWDDMIQLGVYEFAGIDEEDGEAMYTFNAEIAREKAPDVYWREQNELDNLLLGMVDKGILEMEIDDRTFESSYVLTDLGKEIALDED